MSQNKFFNGLSVTVNARVIDEDREKGQVVLEIPARELTAPEHEFLSKLFPHCEQEVAKLLLTETYIAALVK